MVYPQHKLLLLLELLTFQISFLFLHTDDLLKIDLHLLILEEMLSLLAFSLPFSFNQNNIRKVKSGFVGKTPDATGVTRWLSSAAVKLGGLGQCS